MTRPSTSFLLKSAKTWMPGTSPGMTNRSRRALLHPAPELVRLRKALWRQAAGVGAVAAPLGKLLDGGAEFAAGGILPAQAILGIERRDVGQPAIAVFLQPYTAAARHFRHLIDRKDQHLAVVADHRDRVAGDG